MITLVVNGERREADVPADMPLLWVLRDVLGLTGTKFGCGIAQCGACTVHLEGKPVRSCLLPVGTIGSRVITTIEAIGATPNGARVQKAWLDLEVKRGICIESIVRWGVLKCHPLEGNAKLLGQDHRDCGVYALAHLDLGHDQSDVTLAADPDERVGRE